MAREEPIVPACSLNPSLIVLFPLSLIFFLPHTIPHLSPFRYDGDPDYLAQVERFFYEMQHVPHFSQRLTALREKQTFAARLAESLELAENLIAASVQVCGRVCGRGE